MTDVFFNRRSLLLSATALLAVAVLGGCQKSRVTAPESDGEDSDDTGGDDGEGGGGGGGGGAGGGA